ncbi:5-methyltetrahydropteroyltriglutamate--homocysteine S-methyltransferase [Desulfobotulus sp. H1]|uniref:5-methyltetrahydropteroyltriglutamate--homocysteine methyltransferase n=1 Tax=Desulfobotulus pelophilus TaxID=2823377 RepID=A0ABT3N4Y4_9BACT|nr:5-methyltetrahydropteroyltriglutamate--homocysteine S-methyltransferase [Desulfobotulus pelophilus]MCW7752517.1 5-methyltetrahydropteroyltriglutamate--homocysteine S-methyltransferase [Desulfobotulus pelophilus]
MLTVTTIGYPRIGKNRELKKAAERYFQGSVTADELLQEGKNLRWQHWQKQHEKGIQSVPSNDFSYYDTLLDTAFLFGMIPERFRSLPQDPIIRTFAMARGYEKNGHKAKALAMKKWFTTNYHYMVPEVDDSSTIGLMGHKPLTEFKEALAYGFHTRPVLPGPYTLLRLTRFSGKTSAQTIAAPLIEAYRKLIRALGAAGATWVQLDEPCLVTDVSEEDQAFFISLYESLADPDAGVSLQLQTYFGDASPLLKTLYALPVQGIGLDFVEGISTITSLEQEGFPEDKILTAGIINGRNIWRNNYQKSLALLRRIAAIVSSDRLVLAPSCSLLHLPYSLGPETDLSPETLGALAFAEEKLEELTEIATLFGEDKAEFHPLFLQNQQRLEQAARIPGRVLPDVRRKTEPLKGQGFRRFPDEATRRASQSQRLKLPLFPCTTIGSFPQTADIRSRRRAFKNGDISMEEYTSFIQQRIRDTILLQESMGLDVLVHGEFERNDMVEFFGEQLEGFLFTKNGWVQSYGTRCVKPPVLLGDVNRPRPMTVDTWQFAQNCTEKPVKGMLTGPVTILNWSFVREDISQQDCLFQLALAIRDEVLDLEARGCAIIQIDEAALREKLPLKKNQWESYLTAAVNAFRLCHDGVRPDTQIHTHMCYSEFGDILDAIDTLDADVITIEASRSALSLVDQLRQHPYPRDIGPGVYDIHSPQVPDKNEILHTLQVLLDVIDPKRLWVNPDCGLKTRREEEVNAALRAMVTAAHELRQDFGAS